MAGSMTFAQWGNDLYTGRRSYPIIGQRKIWFTIVAILGIASVAILVVKPLVLGIDFRGGTEFTVNEVSSTEQSVAIDAVQEVLPEDEPRVAVVGGSAVRVQTELVEDAEATAITEALARGYGVETANV